MAPRLRSAGRSSTNDSTNAGNNGDSENGGRPASINSSPPSAKNAAAQGGQPDDDENDEASPALPGDADETAAEDRPSSSKDDRGDDNQVSLPASSFERAAHQASRKGKAVGPSSSSLLSSEYDSEDIIVAPRHPPEPSSPPNSGDTSNKNRPKPNGSSSDLSDLDSTPEPVDPELIRLAGEERRRKLELCDCEGWCTCERYKIFYGFGPYEENSDSGAGSAAKDNDKAVPSTKRKRAAATDAEDNDQVGATAKKMRAAMTEMQNEDFEDDFGFLSSSQSKDSSDSNNTSHDAAEGSDFELPSQTHLSERVLANEQFPESALRSTLTNDKRRNDFENEQVYSWDRGDKPMRPPAGWVGGEWVGGRGKGKAKMK
jgi:hypothetical protein